MPTCRKLISDVLEGVDARTLDDRISRRYILSRLLGKALKFIKQDSDSRRSFKLSESWSPLPCIELCETDAVECCAEAVECNTLMKSRKKIPETFQTSYGNMLKIFTINRKIELKQTSFFEYKEIARREWKNPNVIYYILLDGYLYVPDREIISLTGFGMFKKLEQVAAFNETNKACISPLDQNFPVPDYLLDPIVQETQMEIAKIYKGIVPDANPNDNPNDKK